MSAAALPPLAVTFFGDFASPESYLTEVALWRLAEAGSIALHCRAAPEGASDGEGTLARVAALEPLAAELGVALRLPPLRSSTGKAHEAALFARELGVEREMRLATHGAHWEEGLDVGRIDVLQGIAERVGLDPFDARVALDIDRYREAVARDVGLARRLGIARAPVTFLGTGPTALILVGAQSPGGLDGAVRERR